MIQDALALQVALRQANAGDAEEWRQFADKTYSWEAARRAFLMGLTLDEYVGLWMLNMHEGPALRALAAKLRERAS